MIGATRGRRDGLERAVEREAHVADVADALLRILLQAAAQHLLHAGRHGRRRARVQSGSDFTHAPRASR